MQLKEYLVRKGLTQGEFAKMICVSDTYLSQVLNKRKRMHPNRALDIERLTQGIVTRDEALFPEKYPDWRI